MMVKITPERTIAQVLFEEQLAKDDEPKHNSGVGGEQRKSQIQNMMKSLLGKGFLHSQLSLLRFQDFSLKQ